MDKQREAFEVWVESEFDKSGPQKHTADMMFKAWQAAQQAQWLPIETAPRNGSVIILYNAGDVAAGWWHPHIYNGVAYDWCFIEDVEIDDDQRVVPNAWLKKHPPTHWMPLPPEPKK